MKISEKKIALLFLVVLTVLTSGVFAETIVNAGDEITVELPEPVDISLSNTSELAPANIQYSWIFADKKTVPVTGKMTLVIAETQTINPPSQTQKDGSFIWPIKIIITNSGPGSIGVEKEKP